jgi:hypothetical protein
MTTFTLLYQDPTTLEWSAEQTLGAWGLARPRLRLVSQQVSALTFTAPGRAVDAPPLFPFLATVILKKWTGGVAAQFFYGVVTDIPNQGDPRSEEQRYTVSDPWWHLENLFYMQRWAPPNSPYSYLVDNPYRSHCFLNQWNFVTSGGGSYWSRTKTDAQIQDAVNYAINNAGQRGSAPGAPLQLAGSVPSIDIPVEEVRDITCGEVLRKQLLWMPDAAAWFDYSTTPPTLYIRRRPALAPVNIPLTGGAVSAPVVKPRYDLLRPSVCVKFEQVTTIDDQSFLGLATQVYPATATGQELRAAVFTVNLLGGLEHRLKGTIQVGAVSTAGEGDDIHADSWWTQKQPWLKNCSSAVISDLTLDPGPLDVDSVNYTNELLPDGGQIAPWMNFQSQRCRVKATIAYSCPFPAAGDPPGGPFTGPPGKKGAQQISVDVMLTNAPVGTNTYYAIANAVAGEQVPSTLAQDFFAGVGFLQYEGSLKLAESEVSGLVGLGQTLNITGSAQSAWAGMNAVVQVIDMNLETGETTVAFGPAVHLGLPDMVELYRLNRYRYTFTNPALQSQPETQEEIELGDATPINNSAGGGSTYTFFGVNLPVPASGAPPKQQGSATLDGGAIYGAGAGIAAPASAASGPPPSDNSQPATYLLHPADLLGTDSNYHPAAFREINVCVDGVVKRMICLCSETY